MKTSGVLVELPWQDIHEIVARDGYVYVATGEAALGVIDVRNPTSPQRGMPTYTAPPGSYTRVEVEPGWAYVVDSQENQLHTFDLSDPAHPRQAGHFVVWGIRDVAVEGNRAYVASSSGLHILDVHDPLHPQEVGFYAEALVIERVTVAGRYAYMGIDTRAFAGDPPRPRQLHVVDVADPSQPRGAGTYSIEWDGPIAVHGTSVFLPASTTGMRVLDVSDPRAPVESGIFDSTGQAMDVTVAAGYLYLANAEGGLVVPRLPPRLHLPLIR